MRHIVQDSPQAAARWLEKIFDFVEGLADFRQLGKPARDVTTPNLHELVVGDFRVSYEVNSTVDIPTVRRASQLIDEDEFASAD